ncbi:hypothetical protein V6N13_004794 [Hibiscus sabdariffa]
MKAQTIANVSLSNSDFQNCKHIILRETTEALSLGKLVGATIVGNKEDIIQDIAGIIKVREKGNKIGVLSEGIGESGTWIKECWNCCMINVYAPVLGRSNSDYEIFLGTAF